MHIHFIGICGVAMSALAIAFHKKGYEVTGSDKGFYPPVSTNLKGQGIKYYPGWHPEKMGQPDLVIVGNVAGSKNPEWIKVQEENIPYLSYPEAIAKFWLKENSIVVAGSYGKTTNTTLLSWIFSECKLDPSYMFGAIAQNDLDPAHIGEGNVSILEGDEYKSSRWDNGPKFAHYSPTHLLLTAAEWDHADIYPTEKLYVETFKKLAKNVPESGLIIANKNAKNVAEVIEDAKTKVITYGNANCDYIFTNIKESKTGLKFEIIHNEQSWQIESPMIGSYNAENICASFAMAREFGLPAAKIVEAIKSFKGIKRRLEKRSSGAIDVYDDIAHSPAKAKSALENVQKIYNGKVFAIFEPNTGNRQEEAKPSYDEVFKAADTVIIPRLTRIKQDPTKPIAMDGKALTETIAKTHSNVILEEDDEKLVEYLKENATEENVIIFLGSHGFRGMIEELVTRIS